MNLLPFVFALAFFPIVGANAQQAQFKEVTAGVFQLPTGRSIDLTEYQILLTMRGQPPNLSGSGSVRCTKIDEGGRQSTFDLYNDQFAQPNAFVISLDGITLCVVPGDRLSLKLLPTGKVALKEKARCNLDVIGFEGASGRWDGRSTPAYSGTSTFRLNC